MACRQGAIGIAWPRRANSLQNLLYFVLLRCILQHFTFFDEDPLRLPASLESGKYTKKSGGIPLFINCQPLWRVHPLSFAYPGKSPLEHWCRGVVYVVHVGCPGPRTADQRRQREIEHAQCSAARLALADCMAAGWGDASHTAVSSQGRYSTAVGALSPLTPQTKPPVCVTGPGQGPRPVCRSCCAGTRKGLEPVRPPRRAHGRGSARRHAVPAARGRATTGSEPPSERPARAHRARRRQRPCDRVIEAGHGFAPAGAKPYMLIEAS